MVLQAPLVHKVLPVQTALMELTGIYQRPAGADGQDGAPGPRWC